MTFYHSIALLPQQTHSSNVAIASHAGAEFPDTDALITFNKDITLGVVTADCVPILLYASDIEAIAAVHAGWKGTLHGILDTTLNTLVSQGADPGNITAIFGPSISMKQYEVDDNLATLFIEAGYEQCVYHPQGEDAKPHLDLQEANTLQLLRKGVPTHQILLSSLCTYGAASPTNTSLTSPILQSYRRDGAASGRNLSIISMTSA